jgi:phosphate transport system substrate-binding protein
MFSRRSFLLTMAGLPCLPLACAPGPDDLAVQGSGATFPAPLYKRWFLELYRMHPNLRINYQAIGSGAGIRQFTEGLTDFGASDAAMSNSELERARKALGTDVLMLPMTAGSVALCYNVPSLKGSQRPLHLTRATLVEILFGRITHWNDPLLVRDNPELEGEERAITWIHRSEGSGTTYAFTNHVGAISSEWKKDPGVNKSVSWPVGIGAKGNNGVAALIDQTPGALGYVEYGYAVLAKLRTAALQNRRGRFVIPDPQSGLAALAGATLPANFRLFIPDPGGENAYPIVTYTWLLLRTQAKSARRAYWIRKALTWCLTEGQQLSAKLFYLPLPDNVARPVLAAVERIGPA